MSGTIGQDFTQRQVGNSTATARIGGLISISTSASGNIGTGEDTLKSYSLPASALDSAGDTLEIEAWGTFAANANSKRVKLYFGSTVIYDSGAQLQNGGSFMIKGIVSRISSTTQRGVGKMEVAETALFGGDVQVTAPTETLTSGSIVIKITGEAVSNADIQCFGMKIMYYAAP